MAAERLGESLGFSRSLFLLPVDPDMLSASYYESKMVSSRLVRKGTVGFWDLVLTVSFWKVPFFVRIFRVGFVPAGEFQKFVQTAGFTEQRQLQTPTDGWVLVPGTLFPFGSTPT